MQPRRLGRTGLSVPPIALGGGGLCICAQNRRLGPDHARGPKGRPRPGTRSALHRGVTYVDTAAYGNGSSETLVGEVMRTRRADCTLASKVWADFGHDAVVASAHDSLRRLQNDHIDVIQLHGRMFAASDLADVLTGGPLDALRMLKDQGKIGHVDVASEEPYSLLPFLAEPDIKVRVSPIGLEPSV